MPCQKADEGGGKKCLVFLFAGSPGSEFDRAKGHTGGQKVVKVKDGIAVGVEPTGT